MAELGLELRASQPLEFPQQHLTGKGRGSRGNSVKPGFPSQDKLCQTVLLGDRWLMALWSCSHPHLLSLFLIHAGHWDIMLFQGDPQEVAGQFQGQNESMMLNHFGTLVQGRGPG